MLKENWENAIDEFAAFLPVDVGRLQDKELIAEAARQAELAKEYRDLGRSLWKIGETERAMLVWREGQGCPKHNGNKRFLEDIQDFMIGAERAC